MGCDIHLQVERRMGGRWTRLEYQTWREAGLADWNVRPGFEGEPSAVTCGVMLAPEALTARSYNTFAILADVRNGSGFAGVVTGSGFVPIAAPRGLPADIDHAPSADDDYWLGDHSWSWVTLAELLAYDWLRVTERIGIVTEAVYRQWRLDNPTGRPRAWCGGISGARVHIINQEQYEAGDRGPVGCELHVRVTWQETYAVACDGFYSAAIPWLTTLGAADDVRLVFGFDS